MIQPEFLEPEGVQRLHDRALLAYGGIPGLKDQGMLLSALDRPLNKLAYSEWDHSIFSTWPRPMPSVLPPTCVQRRQQAHSLVGLRAVSQDQRHRTRRADNGDHGADAIAHNKGYV